MASIRVAFLAALFAFAAHAQFGTNSTRLRGTNICNPLTTTDTSALTWDAGNNCWNGAATAGVLTSTQPIFQTDTCTATIVANTLVQASGSTITPALATAPILGIARAGCVGTGSTTIAMVGSESCKVEGAVTAGHWLINGSTNKHYCKDSGTADISGIPNTTPVAGLARANATDGNLVEVTLFGSGQYGLDDGGAGGGSGDFSSNTSSSVDGELVVFSGTAGKTGKRSNTTAAVASITAGVPGAATAAGVKGLWSGTCDATTYLRGDGACAAAGGGSTYTAGTGISLAGGEFSLDSATQRTFLIAQKTIDFASITAQTCLSDTITVTGALTGEQPLITWSTAEDDGIFFKVRVSATDTVTIKACNFTGGAINPASNTFTATVIKTF